MRTPDATGLGRPVAVVTGGTSGIGRGVSRRLAVDGYRVAAIARRPPANGEPQPDWFLGADVSDEAQVAAAADELATITDRVAAVVTCAGVIASERLEASEDHVRQMLDVNLLGTITVCRALTPMLRAQAGAVVTMSSTMATSPQPGVSAYIAAKGGVEAYTRALALELAGDGVRVNCVRPALVESRIWVEGGMPEDDYEALLRMRAAQYPLGRVGDPDDVAGAVSFLVSPESSWITGVVLPVDGGVSLTG